MFFSDVLKLHNLKSHKLHPPHSASDLHFPSQIPSQSSQKLHPGLSGLWIVSACLSLGCVATALPTIHPLLTRAIGTTWQVNFVFVLAALISVLLLATPRFIQSTAQSKRRSNPPYWLLRSSMVIVILTLGMIFSILAAPSISG